MNEAQKSTCKEGMSLESPVLNSCCSMRGEFLSQEGNDRLHLGFGSRPSGYWLQVQHTLSVDLVVNFDVVNVFGRVLSDVKRLVLKE